MFETFLGVTHNVSPKATATLELGLTVMDSHDHEVISKKLNKPELAMYYDIAF